MRSDVVWLKGDASTAARVGRIGTDVIIEWPGFLRMRTAAHGRTTLEPLCDVEPHVMAKMSRFARAIPQYLRGALVFHASAVAYRGRGLLILGESGAGKSTTAALLCRDGAALLSDDTAVATFEDRSFVLHPVEDAHWLDRRSRHELGAADDYDDKRPLVPARVHDGPVPLAAVVVLAVHDEDRPVVTRERGSASALRLLDAALQIPLGRERSKQDFDAVARVTSAIPVYRVLRGPSFSSTLSSELLSLLP